MKELITALCCALLVGTLARADIKPVDSDKPIFKVFVPTQDIEEHVIAVVSVSIQRNGMGITVVLNPHDRKMLADLQRRFDRVECAIEGLSSNKIPGLESKPPVGVAVGAHVVTHGEDGILEFTESKLPPEMAFAITKYLRRRFGK